jgi:hypothetical protein
MPTDNITILFYLMLSWFIPERHIMSFLLKWFCIVDFLCIAFIRMTITPSDLEMLDVVVGVENHQTTAN